ncbi:KxYKxGKxW signal peptide domain-containing protein [Companilactobacillus zhachilii]|uniref:KxYKxGKxW signal peptide domain-containing protein n=1 Tax=Companilactobacillus zhachilii TaxID=2304606 RepID=UPI0040343494
MMRFQQLMRKSNAILKKKMYKSGKNWIVKSTLSLAGGLVLFGVSQSTVVKADSVNTQLANVQGKEIDSSVNNNQDAISGNGQNQEEIQTNDNRNEEIPVEVKTETEESVPSTTQVGEQDKNNQEIQPGQNEQLKNDTVEGGTGDDEEIPTNQDSTPTMGNVAGVNWHTEKIYHGLSLTIEPGEMEEITSGSDPWGSAGDYLRNNIKSITIVSGATASTSDNKVIAGTSVSGLFQGFKNITGINGLANFDLGLTDDLSELFSGCTSLTSLDLSSMNFKQSANLSNMLEGDSKLFSLKLSPSTNLTNIGLDVGDRNNINKSEGLMGWNAYDEEGSMNMTKTTDDLKSLYDGSGKVQDPIIWKNIAPGLFKIIGEDTNGKILGTAILYCPIGYTVDDKNLSEFRKKINDLSSNGSAMLYDSDTGLGSRDYLSVDGVNQYDKLPSGVEIDKNGIKFRPFTKEMVADHSIEEYLETTINLISNEVFSMNFLGMEEDIHIVYPAKQQSSSGSGSSSTIDQEIEGIEETIATYAERPDVRLYDDNGSIITDRKLAPNSDWFTDESMRLNKDKFYRVATNQWAKADDVYLYYPNESKVRVNSGSIARLVTDEGKAVTDRALQPLSNWYTDKYIYINDVKYYRVATNEFVSANDVTEY